MEDFQNQVEKALLDVFDPETVDKSKIERVVKKATELKSDLENDDDPSLELTVDKIKNKMEERSSKNPTEAWNHWIGSLEGFEVLSSGYQA